MPRASRSTAMTGDSTRTLRRKSGHTLETAVERLKSFKDIAKSPIPLSKAETNTFNDVLKSRELVCWSPNDLMLAALLAKGYQDLLDVEKQLAKSGVTFTDDDGLPHIHPLVNIRQKLQTNVRSLVNTLGMSASTKGLTTPQQKKRNAAEGKTRALMEELEGETDLI